MKMLRRQVVQTVLPGVVRSLVASGVGGGVQWAEGLARGDLGEICAEQRVHWLRTVWQGGGERGIPAYS